MKLTPNEVRKIARLARLDLSEAEIKLFQQQLGEVLGYIETLNEVDVQNVPPTAQVSGLRSVLADDHVMRSLPVDQALQNAPDKKGSSIKVRAVFGKERT